MVKKKKNQNPAPQDSFSDEHGKWSPEGGDAAPGQTWILTLAFTVLAK